MLDFYTPVPPSAQVSLQVFQVSHLVFMIEIKKDDAVVRDAVAVVALICHSTIFFCDRFGTIRKLFGSRGDLHIFLIGSGERRASDHQRRRGIEAVVG